MTYNYKEHIELLNYQQELEKQNKFLINQDSIKYSKLVRYSATISEYLHWSQKEEYLQLIKDFLNFKIDGKEFDNRFSKMVKVIEEKSRLLFKNYEELKHIEPSPRSIGFSTWISEIYLCCDEFYVDYDLNEGEDRFLKTEEQLRDAVKSLFSEILEYF